MAKSQMAYRKTNVVIIVHICELLHLETKYGCVYLYIFAIQSYFYSIHYLSKHILSLHLSTSYSNQKTWSHAWCLLFSYKPYLIY